MKSLSRRNLKIVAATAMTVFSLFAATVGAFAWFTSKLSAANNGTEFSVYTDDISLDYSIYKYDINIDRPVKIEGQTSKGFVLNQYDMVFKERNKYNPVYIEIEISGLHLADSGSLIFCLDRNTDAPAMDSNHNLSAFISSVTKYAVRANGAIQNGIYDPQSVENTWDNLNSIFYDVDTSGQLTTQNFISGSAGAYVKSSGLEFNVTYSSSDFLNGSLYVYLYANYDEVFAEAYSHEHGFNEQSIASSSYYTLGNDLSCIRIERA